MSELSMDNVSISHDMNVHRTMFTKPIMSHTQSVPKGKRVNQSIPTCNHYGIIGHTRSNCLQIRSQKPWKKTLIPKKDELGLKEQVKMLCDQVKLISEKLVSSPLMSKDLSWLTIKNLPNKSGLKRKIICV
jgi:hypothetical protein